MSPRTRLPSRTVELRRPQSAVGLLIGVAVLVVALVATQFERGRFVPRLAIENPTLFSLNVAVAGGERDGWTELGTIGRETTRDLLEVPDQGSEWVFRLSYAGVASEELVLTRSQLREAGWRVVVPSEVAELLAREGLDPFGG